MPPRNPVNGRNATGERRRFAFINVDGAKLQRMPVWCNFFHQTGISSTERAIYLLLPICSFTLSPEKEAFL